MVFANRRVCASEEERLAYVLVVIPGALVVVAVLAATAAEICVI